MLCILCVRPAVHIASNLYAIPNGLIATDLCLACALRYFASGSPLDILAKYGISHTEVLESIWYIVEALNKHLDFEIRYPTGNC
jgi:hypothetical protein